jgi:hypothetical protein
MATNQATGKAVVVARAQALIAGANKHLSNVTQSTLAGQSLTPAHVIEKLQSLVTLRTAVDTAEASAKAKVVAETTDAPALRTFMGAFATYVKAAYLTVTPTVASPPEVIVPSSPSPPATSGGATAGPALPHTP